MTIVWFGTMGAFMLSLGVREIWKFEKKQNKGAHFIELDNGIYDYDCDEE